MKNNLKKAFSLIEISIVILVVGVLIAGISRGLKMAHSEMILVTAKSLTDKAPVPNVEGLELWLETTSENSLAIGTTSFVNIKKPEDGQPIGRWNDLNPMALNSSYKNHALQATSNYQPLYMKYGINGLPALLFDGSSDFFSYNGNFLVNSDYTIFIVEARTRDGSVDNFFLAGSEGSQGNNLILGYYGNVITHSHWGAYRIDNSEIGLYKNPTPRVHTFSFGKNFGKASFVNGGQKLSDTTQKTPLSSYLNSSIGKAYVSNYFKGYIGEIIVYSKDLSDTDRKLIETYLIEKWRIKI